MSATLPATPLAVNTTPKSRIGSIDLIRGAVMIGSIFVVADPMTLPHLSRVPAAIAGKELVAIGRPDDFP
jgi:hypothetical protein